MLRNVVEMGLATVYRSDSGAGKILGEESERWRDRQLYVARGRHIHDEAN